MTSESKAKNTLPNQVVGALAMKFDKSWMTIYRWVKNNDVILTTDLAKEVFAQYNLDWNGGDVLEISAEKEAQD